MTDTADEEWDDLRQWWANWPTLVQERSHANHWHNRASDLHASAGAIWVAMQREEEAAIANRLGLSSGFSMRIACMPVYYMLCGLALELAMKARLVQIRKTPEEIKTHRFDKLLSLLDIKVSDEERQLLQFYQESMIWAGRYPTPVKATDQALLSFYKLAGEVLTEPVPEITGIRLVRRGDATDWVNFHALWLRYSNLFEFD